VGKIEVKVAVSSGENASFLPFFHCNENNSPHMVVLEKIETYGTRNDFLKN
jgi:hypothetical protein